MSPLPAKSSWVRVLAFLAILAWSVDALAIDGTTRAMLRELSQEGVTAYEAGDYVQAVQKLEKAYAILPTAPLGLWSARALEKTGRLVEAAERFLAASRAPLDPGGETGPQQAAQAEARAEHAALEPRIPRLTVTISRAAEGSVELLVNEKAVLPALVGEPIPVNPGRVDITVRSRGRETERSLTIGEGERKVIDIDASAPGSASPSGAPSSAKSAPPRSWQPAAGWITLGVGAAGLALGAVTGGMAMDLHSSLGCSSAGCPDSTTEDERARGNTLRALSTTGFIAGGVLVAAGVTLLATAPRREPRSAYIAPVIGLASLGLRGRF